MPAAARGLAREQGGGDGGEIPAGEAFGEGVDGVGVGEFDGGGELALGRLPEQGFRELWFGAKARAWRAAHLAGRFEGACARCGGINWYGLPEGAEGWAGG